MSSLSHKEDGKASSQILLSSGVPLSNRFLPLAKVDWHADSGDDATPRRGKSANEAEEYPTTVFIKEHCFKIKLYKRRNDFFPFKEEGN